MKQRRFLTAVLLVLVAGAAPLHAQSLSNDTAFARYREAVDSMEAKDHAAARRHATAAIEDYPGHLLAHYLLGQVASLEEKWTDAAAAFAKVAELYPRSFAAHRELGVALEQLARVEGGLSRAEDAERAWDTALAIRPDDEDVRARLAFLLIEKQHPDRALPHLVRLAEGGTSIPDVWTALGRVQYERGDLSAAERAFTRATELRDVGRNWFNLGVVRLRVGDRAGALAAFQGAARHADTREQAQREIQVLGTVAVPSAPRTAPLPPPRP